MLRIRPAAVAGRFYTDRPAALRAQVEDFIDRGATQVVADATADPRAPKALIVPHAGYIYSGPIAGSAYAAIAHRAGPIHRVVLLGPAHRMGFPGLAFSDVDAFATPLGKVPVDRAALAGLADLPQLRPLDAAFEGEHCLEVQLPFLQVLLGDFQIVPLLVGDAAEAEVAEVIARLWGGDETLLLISSDLSHYMPYALAQALDAQTTQAICALTPEHIAQDQACGRKPIAGLLREARRHGLVARVLDLRNSGDTAGPRDQVVGYGAYALG